MNTYQPGQKVRIKSKGLYEGEGEYVRAINSDETVVGLAHYVLSGQRGELPYFDHEVEPIEAPAEPGMRTVLINGVTVPIIEAGPYGPHILLDDDMYVTTGVLEKLGFEVRS